MLEKLRAGFTKILVFGLFAILILSFAIWGIGDVVRTGSTGPIAEVGDAKVSINEFTSALQQRRQLLTRQFGQSLTPEQSRALGIDAAVLSELVNAAAISNHAKATGIRLSDATVAELIRSDPAFQSPDKTFSRALFDERMRQAGFTEQRYFAERRTGEIREQLSDTLVSGMQAPDTMAAAVHRYREETRVVSFLRLVPGDRIKVSEPDEKTLKSFYEEQKRTFTEPERRHVVVMVATPEVFKERAKVSDAEVRAAWEQARPAWDLPERRRIQQIFFKTKAEADGEAKAIEGGKSFLLAALEAMGSQGRLDQGLVARREISDPGFAKAVFELEVNKLSAPIQVRGGYIIARVTEIEPARARPFEEVAAEVRQSIEDTRSREAATKLHEEIEDRRGASDAPDKMKKIAAELGLKLIEAPAVDAQGKGPDGKPALEHAEADRLLAAAFEGDRSTPREVIQLNDGSEAWVDVLDVKPAAAKAFEAIKAEVEMLWREREVQSLLGKEAQALVGRLKAGAALETIAKEVGATGETTPAFKRAAPPPGFSPAAARLAFTLPKGGAASASGSDPKSRLVFQVAEIRPAEATSKEQGEALRRELTEELQRDAIQTYVGALRQQQGVKVNEAVYKRAVGLDQAN